MVSTKATSTKKKTVKTAKPQQGLSESINIGSVNSALTWTTGISTVAAVPYTTAAGITNIATAGNNGTWLIGSNTLAGQLTVEEELLKKALENEQKHLDKQAKLDKFKSQSFEVRQAIITSLKVEKAMIDIISQKAAEQPALTDLKNRANYGHITMSSFYGGTSIYSPIHNNFYGVDITIEELEKANADICLEEQVLDHNRSE